MPPLKKCEIHPLDAANCHREARYALRINEDIKGIDLYKDKNWYQVCGTHDKQLGRTNLISGGWSKKDAIAVERTPEIEPSIPSYI